jgi:hypothetical protein
VRSVLGACLPYLLIGLRQGSLNTHMKHRRFSDVTHKELAALIRRVSKFAESGVCSAHLVPQAPTAGGSSLAYTFTVPEAVAQSLLRPVWSCELLQLQLAAVVLYCIRICGLPHSVSSAWRGPHAMFPHTLFYQFCFRWSHCICVSSSSQLQL